MEKVEKLVGNIHEKTKDVIHIKNSKLALNNGLVLKKLHRIIKFKQKVSLKSYIDMNTDLKKKAKIIKDFFKLMNNAVFGETMENMRN